MRKISLLAATLLTLLLTACSALGIELATPAATSVAPSADTALRELSSAAAATEPQQRFSADALPVYEEAPYKVVHNNEPYFDAAELIDVSFESYSDLDDLGRCGAAFASVGRDLMPTEERGSISEIKPSGWKQAMYDFVDGSALYNRCHLIGWQLSGENANPENLITGTRYLNVQGMLPFENLIADYVKETDNHVLYRVTPVFNGDELVARGVLMEAESVEDEGEGVLFCVYAFNVQPGVDIDYATGVSSLSDGQDTEEITLYIVNTGTGKFHLATCDAVSQIRTGNKSEMRTTKEELLDAGYEPCGRCRP